MAAGEAQAFSAVDANVPIEPFFAEAEKSLEGAVARDRDPVVVMHLGTVRQAQGRGDEALALYREALRFGLDEDVARVTSAVEELARGLDAK